MVQKQAAYSSRAQGESFADDDPLAELARIVGFDQPQQRAPEPVREEPRINQPVEPEFNLEDELMREFGDYAPAAAVSAATSRLAEPVEVERLGRQEPDYREFAAIDDEPFDMGLSEPGPLQEAAPPQPSEPDVPAFDLADELEFAVSEAEPQREHHLDPQSSFAADAGSMSIDLPELAQPNVEPVPQRPIEPPEPRLHLPLANFPVQPPRHSEFTIERDQPVARSVAIPSVETVPMPVEQPVHQVSFAPEATDNRGFSPFADLPETPTPIAPSASEISFAAPEAPVPAPSVAPVAAPVEPFDFAAFTAERVNARASEPVQAPTAPASRQEPDFGFSFADELTANEDYAQPAPARAAAYAAAPVSELGSQNGSDPFLDDGFDPFADHEFDLQLDELDLDLSDIEEEEGARAHKTEPTVAAKPVPVPAPAVAAPSAEPDWMDDLLQEASIPVQAPVQPTPAPVVAAAAAAGTGSGVLASVSSAASASTAQPSAVQPHIPQAPMMSSVETSYGFDPSEIAEQDEQIESFTGMDVPEVPHVEPKHQAPPANDYDFDLDSELATLFNEPVAPDANGAAVAAQAAALPPLAPVVGKPNAAPKLDDFDAFEKALEDDLKSSMNAPQSDAAIRRGHIAIAGDGRAARARKIRTGLLATTAAVVIMVAAGGVYAWLTGAAAPGGSDEPIVIAADKDPIKIVPEDPGGKAVPNQDKAVYDRVAGAAIEDPQQESLISSNEEPIDVVQRTLIPENAPFDGDVAALPRSTPVGDTEDPRLLPGIGDPTANAAEEEVTIAPRRVRTMIVRPDGTLVAQEVPAEVPASLSSDAGSGNVLAAPSLPSPEDSAAARAAVLAEVTGQAAPAQAAPNTTAAPVPTTRPAEQPVNVVGTVTDQGNLRPAQQPSETASAAAAQAPVSNPGGFVIQIASLPSEADAQRSYQSLSSRYANIIGGRGVDIQRAEIAGKGTYFRVRIPAGNREQAVALCEQYRSAGGSCIVAR